MSIIADHLPFFVNQGTYSVFGSSNEHNGYDFEGTVETEVGSTHFETRSLEREGDTVVLTTFKDTDRTPDTRIDFRPSSGGQDGYVRLQNGGDNDDVIDVYIPVNDLAAAKAAYEQASPTGPLTKFTLSQSVKHGYKFKFGK